MAEMESAPDDMMERVALAIFKSTFHPDDAANEALVAAKRQEWPADWRRAARAARAAIEAMREPTVRMILEAPDGDCVDVWRGMIDAALTPPGETK